MEDFERPWIDRLKDKARAQAAESTAIGLIADAEQILAEVVRTERNRIREEGQQYFPGETTSEYGPIVSALASLEVAAKSPTDITGNSRHGWRRGSAKIARRRTKTATEDTMGTRPASWRTPPCTKSHGSRK